MGAGALFGIRDSFAGDFYRTGKKGVVSDDYWNRSWVLCHKNKTGGVRI